MSYDRKYLCPYCQKKIPKSKLIIHLGRAHSNNLPKDFTPLQTAYHIINNRPYEYRGKCRICSKPTFWDENKGRYNFLCGDSNCDKEWVNKMKSTMGDKYGAYRPTSTPEGLKKMLAARRISGTYKFQDGHEFTYTGSYELETLKFLDLVMNVKSEDLQVPGPVVNYDFQGKTHMYITDMYYIPYNLIIEVKDGGSSPNKNPAMAENRAKQMAKENWIIKKTEYNYLRLTDKDLSQLFNIFAELKFALVENNPTRIIRVHEAVIENTTLFKENMYAAMQGFMPMNPKDVVIINYMKKNSYTGEEDDYAIAMDQKFDTIFARDESGIFKKVNRDFLEGCIYTPYIVSECRDQVEEYIRNNINTIQMKSSLYEAVFGHKLYSDDQILFEQKAKKYKDYYQVLSDTEDTVASMVQPGLKTGIPETENAIEESNINNNCLIISCFAGVGKKYAMDYLNRSGINYASIEKLDKTFDKSKLVENIQKACKGNQVVFIPYYLGLDKDIKGKIKYTIVYPDIKLKSEYLFRYKTLGFTDDQINYLNTYFEDMIKDIEKSNCRKVKLTKENSYVLEYILDNISTIQEGVIFDEKDIYYNKDKFDSGEINLCFIVGLSGSGKTTLSRKYLDQKNVEVIELDDNMHIKGFSKENLKEYGKLMSSFWNRPRGDELRKRMESKDDTHISIWDVQHEFIDYTIKFAASHKNMKFILEGVWTLEEFKPEELKNYAVFIKGTSSVKSTFRAGFREFKNGKNLKEKVTGGVNQFINSADFAKVLNKNLKLYRKYFESKCTITESANEFNLNNFTKKKIDKTLCEKYKDKPFYQNLKYATYYDTDDGYVWFDKNDNYVGMVAVDKSEHPYWIFNLIVNKKYRGHGLGTQLLDFAVKSLGGEALSVKKTNDIAQNMYQKYGFIAKKTKNGDKDMNYMYLKSALNKKSTQKMLDEAADVSDTWWITSDDGVENCCVKVKGYDKPMRGRASMVPLRYNNGIWEAFFKKEKNEFNAPGGGIDKKESPMDAAIRECKEEVRIVVEDPLFVGMLIEYDKTPKQWVKDHVENPDDWWYGYYTYIHAGMYSKKYSGNIAPRDQDPEMMKGKWYNVEDLFNDKDFTKEYETAIKKYIKYQESKGGKE